MYNAVPGGHDLAIRYIVLYICLTQLNLVACWLFAKSVILKRDDRIIFLPPISVLPLCLYIAVATSIFKFIFSVFYLIVRAVWVFASCCLFLVGFIIGRDIEMGQVRAR